MAQHMTTDVHGLSRALHAIDSITTRAMATGVVLVAVVVSVATIAVLGFASEFASAFVTIAAAITLVMVFVIQLRAIPQADDRFVHIEVGSDDELGELEELHLTHRASVLADFEPDSPTE
jgi:low affinity Fe/Cu permease